MSRLYLQEVVGLRSSALLLLGRSLWFQELGRAGRRAEKRNRNEVIARLREERRKELYR